jgi:hypothetical protein
MTILSVREKSGSRGSINDQGITEYTRVFNVVTDSAFVDAPTVRTATGLPRRFDIYVAASGAFDTTSVCTDVEAEQDDENPLLWTVSAKYGKPSINEDQQDPNPLLRPSVISWNFQKYQRAVWKDIDGKGIVNSANMYFDPPPVMDDSRPILVIQRNEAAFNPGLALQYQDAINSDPFFGASPGQCKVAGISAQSQTENRYFYWAVSYEFEFRREGWALSILDQGRYRIGKIPVFQKTTDGVDSEVQVVDPVPLNGNGGELANPTPSTLKFIDFKVYKSLSFGSLGLP